MSFISICMKLLVEINDMLSHPSTIKPERMSALADACCNAAREMEGSAKTKLTVIHGGKQEGNDAGA